MHLWTPPPMRACARKADDGTAATGVAAFHLPGSLDGIVVPCTTPGNSQALCGCWKSFYRDCYFLLVGGDSVQRDYPRLAPTKPVDKLREGADSVSDKDAALRQQQHLYSA